MKVLNVENAKATWLFDLRLLNPRGVTITSLMAGIAERYKFAKVPANPLDVKEGGLSFVEGVFRNSKGIELGVSITAYGDGLVADTFSNTDNTTEFLRDLAQFAAELGFPFPDEKEMGKSFTSILGVFCDVPLLALNPKLEFIAKLVESKLVTMDGKPRTIEFAGISLFSEDVSQNKAPAVFKFERKFGQPFSANRYYAQAPLETDEHVVVLEEFEKILKT
ncbi:MAG: hypothetical protein ABSA48_13635 [Terracidiphilus sp.]|jgi:hypothetical protein